MLVWVIVLRHLPLAECVVQRGVDHLRHDAEACRLVAIDADHQLRRVALLVG